MDLSAFRGQIITFSGGGGLGRFPLRDCGTESSSDDRFPRRVVRVFSSALATSPRPGPSAKGGSSGTELGRSFIGDGDFDEGIVSPPCEDRTIGEWWNKPEPNCPGDSSGTIGGISGGELLWGGGRGGEEDRGETDVVCW